MEHISPNYVSLVTEVSRNAIIEGWLMDSSATVHVCHSLHKFISYYPITQVEVVIGSKVKEPVEGEGTVQIYSALGNILTLSNVLQFPSISKFFISVSQLDIKGFRVAFVYCKVIIDEGIFIMGEGHIQCGLYKLEEAPKIFINIFGDSSSFPSPNTTESQLH
ncbi:hypothetical protein Lser_V15G17463 [Lactuca serriola]